MKIKVYQSELNKEIEITPIAKLRYIGETFEPAGLTDNNEYFLIDIDGDDLFRIVDDSGEDYLYSIENPKPWDDEGSLGGKWKLLEDYNGKVKKYFNN